MKRLLCAIGCLFFYCVLWAQSVVLLPYDAQALTPEQKNANPDRLAYPTGLKETIQKEVDFLCNTKIMELGPFSVSPTKQVIFSPGNLQFNAARGTHQCADGSTQQGTWRFAEHQWDYTNSAYGERIDLFGWGTSGWVSGAENYDPLSYSIDDGGYLEAGLTGEYAYADWALYNRIGDDAPGTWRTLTIEEWDYLLYERPNSRNLCGYALIDEHYVGMVLLPDTWVQPAGLNFIADIYGGEYFENSYTLVQWAKMEEAGAVFLPAAWQRRGEDIYREDENKGYYWSVSYDGGSVAWAIGFRKRETLDYEALLHYGLSVRPVKDIVYPFSVAEDRRVLFAPGNMQYRASTKTWRFAEHQWDYVGDETNGTVYVNGGKCSNTLISENYSGWIDLFGWGTSGWSSGAMAYQPYSTSADSLDYLVANDIENDLTAAYAKADWAVYNRIGEDPAGTWRTLTYEEWDYLLTKRPHYYNLYGLATVNEVHGCILLPDNWMKPNGIEFAPALYGSLFSDNIYTAEQWDKMEEMGAVFLPAGGSRIRNHMYDTTEWGEYWTATSLGTAAQERTGYKDGIWCVVFYEKSRPNVWPHQYRFFGNALRPAKDLP